MTLEPERSQSLRNPASASPLAAAPGRELGTLREGLDRGPWIAGNGMPSAIDMVIAIRWRGAGELPSLSRPHALHSPQRLPKPRLPAPGVTGRGDVPPWGEGLVGLPGLCTTAENGAVPGRWSRSLPPQLCVHSVTFQSVPLKLVTCCGKISVRAPNRRAFEESSVPMATLHALLPGSLSRGRSWTVGCFLVIRGQSLNWLRMASAALTQPGHHGGGTSSRLPSSEQVRCSDERQSVLFPTHRVPGLRTWSG